MELAFHGARVLGRAWREATIMAEVEQKQPDKHAPGASIDMRPLSWRKSWPLSISKSGSAGRACRRRGTLGPPTAVHDLCAPARRSNLVGKASCSKVWLRPPPSGPRVGRHRLCRGTGGIGADPRRRNGTRGPRPCARPASRRHALRSAWQGCDRGAPLQSRTGCDVPSHDGGRGTLPGPQISGPPAQRRAHFAGPLQAPAARRVKSPKTQARS